MINYILSSIIGYLLGSLNGAYIVSRCSNKNILVMGDKNPGASNAILHLGLVKGILAGLIDFSKTAVAWLICGALFTQTPYASLIGASFTVIGHCFSIFMKFKGGK